MLFLNIFGFYMAAYSITMQDKNSQNISVKFEAESSIINARYTMMEGQDLTNDILNLRNLQ